MIFAIVSCYEIPLLLFIWCCLWWRIRKNNENTSKEELKNYYWLKNSNGNEMMEEKNYNIEKILAKTFFWWILIFLSLALCYKFDKYDFSALRPFISNETFWCILGINIDILTVVSLVIALKKDYYLGIDVKSVMKLYNIPDFIIVVLICSCSVFLFYGIYNLKVIEVSEYSIFIELVIYTFILLILYNLIRLICTTINICINSSKKEMKTFKCLG